MLRLAFQGKIPHRKGLMSTFRVGEKWVESWLEEGAKPFDVVLVDDYGNHADGIVISVEYMQLNNVTEEALRLDCKRPGRMWESLYYELLSYYSNCAKTERNQEVDPTSYVSVVWFIIK